MKRLSTAEVRRLDRLAIDEYGMPGAVLMENAGAAAARLLASFGVRGSIAIACGRGNNGGDGFVIARHLDAAGHAVRLLVAAAEPPTGDAAVNLRIAERGELPIAVLAEDDEDAWHRAIGDACWVVDALLGTGSRGAPRGSVAAAVRAINRAGGRGTARVLAVDLPSGLDADTGTVAGDCVRADVTATFVAEKPGFGNPEAAAFTGRVHVLPIGVPRALLRRFGVSR